MRLVSFVCALMVVTFSAFAQPVISDAEVNTRVDAISKTLRCVVCQNQSIYDSTAPLATDMKVLVEKRVRLGDSDEDVRDYLREAYGDFILMKPPLQANTMLLWFLPLVLAFIAGGWFLTRSRGRVAAPRPELSAGDRAKLESALAPGDEDAA